MKEYILEFSVNFLKNFSVSSDIESIWKEFENMCNHCLTLVPYKLSSVRYNRPWINSVTRYLTRKKQRLYNRARLTGRAEDWTKYKDFKKIVQKECRKAHNDYVSNLTGPDFQCCNKRLWSYIKNQRKDQFGIPALLVDGQILSEDIDKAEALNNYFCSVFTRDEEDFVPDLIGVRFPNIDEITISAEGVRTLLSKLDPYKAEGPDGIPARFLREVAFEMAPALTLVYQASINQSKLPKDWKKARIVPIFKKGDRACVENYRPVSLTCILCKTLEHIISSAIYDHFHKHNILCNEQYGFRKHRSCESQLLSTVNDFAVGLNEGSQTDVILLDVVKPSHK